MAITEGAVSLVVGTVLALGALSVVLAPLINGVDASGGVAPKKGRSALDDDDRPSTAVDALREIEFDRETGKLSDSDYAELKSRYTRAALAELRAADRVPADASSDAAVEAVIARARGNQQVCRSCGPRPEPDATYCSGCGSYLPGACGACGTPIDVAGSRFCSGCGAQLAAA